MDEKQGPSPHIDAGKPKSRRKGQFAPGNKFRFLPGQGGRQGGAENRTTKISRAYQEWLEQMVEGGQMTRAEAVAHRMGDIALRAKPGAAIAAAREITDRAEGKAMQTIAVRQELDEATAKRLIDLAHLLLPKDDPLLLEAEIIEEGEEPKPEE